MAAPLQVATPNEIMIKHDLQCALMHPHHCSPAAQGGAACASTPSFQSHDSCSSFFTDSPCLSLAHSLYRLKIRYIIQFGRLQPDNITSSTGQGCNNSKAHMLPCHECPLATSLHLRSKTSKHEGTYALQPTTPAAHYSTGSWEMWRPAASMKRTIWPCILLEILWLNQTAGAEHMP